MKGIEALNKLKKNCESSTHSFDYELHDVIEKELKALEIIKKFAVIDNGEIYICPDGFITIDDEPIIYERYSKEEYELLKEVLNG